MSRYRQVHCCIWNDDKFPFASDDAKLVFLHLLTTPLSSPFGLYKASIGALADEIRWDKRRYEKAFGEAFAKGFVKHDSRHLVILIPNFVRYNPPGNPNVLISWAKIFYELPDSYLKIEWNETLKGLLKGFGEGFAKAYAKAFAKGMPNQEQEQEQELKNIVGHSPSVVLPHDDAPPFEAIVAYLNEKAGVQFKTSAKATQRHISARWKEGFRLSDFQAVISHKAGEWLTNPDMSRYLRPETLFGAKFESYLNETMRDTLPGAPEGVYKYRTVQISDEDARKYEEANSWK